VCAISELLQTFDEAQNNLVLKSREGDADLGKDFYHVLIPRSVSRETNFFVCQGDIGLTSRQAPALRRYTVNSL
jgi:hypothetical protein